MRINSTITVASGTPVNLATLAATAAAASSEPVYATRIFVQMLTGGSGRGYVMDGIKVGRVPATTNADDVTAEMGPATASAPGGSYSDVDYMGGGIDIRRIWIDGSNTGDKIKVSYDRKV